MPAAPMPLVTVLVAWANSPLDDPALITNLVGPDVVAAGKWTIMSSCGAYPSLVAQLPAGARGRQHELQEFEPASMKLRFDNSSGRFNPWNTASPYYGYLKPGRLLQVRAQWNLIVKAYSDFEDASGNWDGCSFTTVSPIEGTRSSTRTVSAETYFEQPIHPYRQFPVEAGRTYSASIRARSSIAGCTLNLVFWWYDANGFSNTGGGSAQVALPTSGDVTVTMSNVTPPAWACSARLGFRFVPANFNSTATLTFDAVGAWPTGTPPAFAAAPPVGARFTGAAHGFPISWPDRRSSWVDAEASDLLRTLNGLDLPASAFDLELSADDPAHLWPLSESPGSTVAADIGANPVPGVYSATARPGAGAALVAGSSATSMGLPLTLDERPCLDLGEVLPATDPFTIAFVVGEKNPGVRHEFLHVPGKLTLYDDGSLGPVNLRLGVYNDAGTLFTVAGPPINDGLPHLVVVSRFGNSFSLDVDDSGSFFISPLTGTVTLSPRLYAGSTVSGSATPGSMASLAVWNSLLSGRRPAIYAAFSGAAWAGDTAATRAGRILDHVGLPAAARDLDATCVSPLQPVAELGGTAGEYLQQLARAEAGAVYASRAGKLTLLSRKTILTRAYRTPAVTFGDLPGQAPFQPDPDLDDGSDDIVNVVTASKAGGPTYRAVDAISRAEHGPRSRSITDLPLVDDREVVDRAHFELATYAEPAFVVRALDIWPREATALIEALLGLDLLDLVIVGRSDIPGTALSQTSLVEHLDDTFTPTDWTLAVALSPHQAQQYWVLGTSQLGVNTRLAF